MPMSEEVDGAAERGGGAAVEVEGGVGFIVKMMTRPSEPPVTRVLWKSCTWHTSAVWPWRRAKHALEQ